MYSLWLVTILSCCYVCLLGLQSFLCLRCFVFFCYSLLPLPCARMFAPRFPETKQLSPPMESGWLLSQNEATQLKSVQSGGRQTKLVVLGIGSSVSESELNATASSPTRNNVIRVQDFTTLMTVRDQLRDTSCTRKWRFIVFTATERSLYKMFVERHYRVVPHTVKNMGWSRVEYSTLW